MLTFTVVVHMKTGGTTSLTCTSTHTHTERCVPARLLLLLLETLTCRAAQNSVGLANTLEKKGERQTRGGGGQ